MKGKMMQQKEIRFRVNRELYTFIEAQSARRHIPMTAVVRELVAKEMWKLAEENRSAAGFDRHIERDRDT